jgi:hypothetical protein
MDDHHFEYMVRFRFSGNGKIKMKEPIEMANKAMKQLSETIELAKLNASS